MHFELLEFRGDVELLISQSLLLHIHIKNRWRIGVEDVVIYVYYRLLVLGIAKLDLEDVVVYSSGCPSVFVF